jgi:uncharacterized protein YxjI
VAKIQERKLSVGDKIAIERDGQTDRHGAQGAGRHSGSFFAIDIDGGHDRKAHGNIVDKEDEIGRNADTVAQISKRWFRGRQGESHGKGRRVGSGHAE